ncbi:hypothetical protein BDV93DRAFT_498398, partial [Ceratobasidium sp. AG-I]
MSPSEKSGVDVPMDHLTSRVLSWLISSCENPKAVDVALKSIAGADRTLPCCPMLECNTAVVIIQRIYECFSAYQLSMGRDLARLGVLSPEHYSSAVIYARSLNVLVSHPEIYNEMYVENLQKVRQSQSHLLSFYDCLNHTKSIAIATLGVAGAASIDWITDSQFYFRYDDIKLYRLFELVCSTQAESTRLPSHPHLLSEMFYSMSREISMLNRV